MAEAQITTLFVIRHGETAWNVDGRLQGQLDIPLNDRGREQAAAAGEYIRAKYSAAGQPLHAVYSSDLSRARETAEAIASACDLKVALDSRLRETNLGACNERSVDEWSEGIGAGWRARRQPWPAGASSCSVMLTAAQAQRRKR